MATWRVFWEVLVERGRVESFCWCFLRLEGVIQPSPSSSSSSGSSCSEAEEARTSSIWEESRVVSGAIEDSVVDVGSWI